jgi:hypothetical protein
VDDIDLLHIDLTKNETVNKVHVAIQENSGCDNFPGQEQLVFNSDDARKGAAVVKRCA